MRTASSLRELRSLTGHGPTTVLVSDPDAILTARRGEIATTLGTDTVWVQPGFRVLRRIAPGLALAGRSAGGRTLDASCGVAAADRAGGIRSSGLAVRLGSSGFAGCFPAGRRSYLMATSPGGDLTVLGSRGVLDNGHIDRAGNAALALGLLGRHPTLVWYLPGLDDLGDSAPPDLATLTPGWVTPVALLALAVTIVAGVWRGRRFGALVVEDLPVVVHARETMEGRARLYQRSASRLHALDALRVGTIGRLAGRLGLPRSADVREVADAAAEATRRERRATADLLVDRVPADDRELVALATRSPSSNPPSTAHDGPTAARRPRPRPPRPLRRENEAMTDQQTTTATAESRAALDRVRTEVGKAVVGQEGAVTGLLIALLAGGHVLLEGVPGVAKTLLVRSLSRALRLDTKRVQFTPDLMPGDITGSLVYDLASGSFEFREGPVFTNILLADEINRTPPKSQAALLEAMEERQVSADGVTRPLPDPFLVAATQNPIEYEGTYLLPEAQLDRFLMKLTLEVPDRDDEFRMLQRHQAGFDPRDLEAAGVTPVLDAMAAARTCSGAMPRPSSWQRSTTSLPCRPRLTVTVATGALPCATRSARLSTPWASALRTRCSMASVSASSMLRSSFSSPPAVTHCASLPSCVAVLRNTRPASSRSVCAETSCSCADMR